MPNDTALPPPPENPERVTRAIRFAVACLLLALCLLNLVVTSMLPKMRAVFADLGAALPFIVVLAFRAQSLLLLTSWILPVATIGILFSKPRSASFHVLGILALIAVCHTTVVAVAMLLPLVTTFDAMGK